MVRVVNFQKRESESGEVFYALELEGTIEMVRSQETGRYYATARRTFLASTFNEKTCASLLGTELPGNIGKISCEPYKYTIPDTNEEVTLTHKYEYMPEAPAKEESNLSTSTVDDFVKFENPQKAFSTNGVE